MTVLKVKKLDESAVLPFYAKEGDSGMDLTVLTGFSTMMYPGVLVLIHTGLAFEIPEGYEVQIRPRSGLACKYGVTVVNSPGTVDAGYRGEIKVGLINLSNSAYHLKEGDRIAQAVLAPVSRATLVEVEGLTDTERGEGSFGHTGR